MEEGQMTKKMICQGMMYGQKKHTHKYKWELQFKLVVQQKMLKKYLSS